ncbi:chondroadherin-like [Diorhabda sublineata]|uniref:chondroadherin-like n=1 Tax=Diorhabda sublineata TaxID=1163346 RepID=UPI0024E08A40|nr:chondroadherin-like [Diorhabda sublineata]
MEDDKIHNIYWRTVLLTLVLTMTRLYSSAAICPTACRCQNDVLKTSCSSASLEFVPIQLNPELHELDLSNNRIVQIYFSFPFYEKLIYLNLSTNKIKTLGNSNFNSQINLTHLDLSSNQIENITKDTFKGLKSLTHLDLSRNNLKELHVAAFRDLYSLIVLKLFSNKIVHLDQGLLMTTKNLKELHLNDNQLLEIPADILIDTLHLIHLSLSKNYIRELKEGAIPNLPDLQTLLLDDNIITEIHPACLANLINLYYLDLSNNNLKIIPTESLSKLSNLNILKLTGNFITSIPAVAFRGLFNLRILYIDQLEALTKIDMRAFVDNVNLEKVNMNHNIGMNKLPSRLFYGNPKITSISVTYNHLGTIEAINFPLDQLKELNVGGNPLQCNCSLNWLWQLVQEYKSKTIRSNLTFINKNSKMSNSDLILDINDITCDGPEEVHNSPLISLAKHHIDCTYSWIAVFSVTISVIFILIIVGGVIYMSPKSIFKSTNTELPITERSRNPSIREKSESYEGKLTEKYTLPTSMIIHNDYGTYSWDPCGASTENIYEQLNDSKNRPHIVYV